MSGDELESAVILPAGGVMLRGDLAVPAAPVGMVLFVCGGGSSRNNPGDRFLAETLRARGLGTLLVDLLTAEEARQDAREAHLRFDLPLLASRLGDATGWLKTGAPLPELPVAYFAANTGAAAALIAAARRPGELVAVVSRGGRPDLARLVLDRVHTPTLLLVGGADQTVLTLNEASLERLAGPRELRVVPGATHLFEEPGALREVARLAGDFILAHLGAAAQASAQP